MIPKIIHYCWFGRGEKPKLAEKCIASWKKYCPDYEIIEWNEVFCNVEYQPDGSSNSMWKQYLRNPKGFAFWRKVCMKYPTSKKRIVVDCIHYCSSSIIARNSHYIAESPKKLLTLLCTPCGFGLYIITKHKSK